MEWLAKATAFDVVVFAIFLLFLVRGVWIGFIRQISSLLGMIGGFLLAGYFDNEFYRLILPYFNDSHTAFLVTYVVLFVAFFFLIKLVGLALKKVMDITLTPWFDRSVGGLFGIIKGIFLTGLLFIILSSYLSGSNKYLKNSITYPYFMESSKVILSFIRDHDLRSYFIPKEPAIRLPQFDISPDDEQEPEKTEAPEPEKMPAETEGVEEKPNITL
ncbi:MAG: CvpA family protein [Desulfobulbales bacterium]|nr:CvpA family protein [Desulfobulbales bacterium]